MPRLFAGIEIPAALSEEIAGLEQPLPGARWVAPDDLHVTLRFFGDVSERTSNELIDHLAAIDLDMFELRVAGLSAHGSKQPSSIWADVEPSDTLVRLQYATERAARASGLEPEKRRFRPHITIARLRRSYPEPIARFLSRNARFAFEPFPVSRFALFSAKPRTGGGPYVLEQVFALAGGSWDDEADAW